jgi:hypothetical protein
MKIIRALYSEAFRRWVSVCIVAVLAGLLCCQVMNTEQEAVRRRQQDHERSMQPDDEDTGTQQPISAPSDAQAGRVSNGATG